MFQILRDIAIVTTLVLFMAEIGKTQELQSDDGGVKLINGCYTLIIVDEGDQGKRQITIQDCRGGRAI